MDAAELANQQRNSLWLDGRAGLHTVAECAGVRERSWHRAAANLPIASMYRTDAKAAHARPFELTNGMLATGKVVEINLCLSHQRVLIGIYALRRGRHEASISDAARQALEFMIANETASTGALHEVRSTRSEGAKQPYVRAL